MMTRNGQIRARSCPDASEQLSTWKALPADSWSPARPSLAPFFGRAVVLTRACHFLPRLPPSIISTVVEKRKHMPHPISQACRLANELTACLSAFSSIIEQATGEAIVSCSHCSPSSCDHATKQPQAAISQQSGEANPGALGRGRIDPHLPIRTSSLLPAPSTGHACEMMEREDWQKAEVGSRNRPTRLLPLCPGCIHNSPDCSS